MENLWAPWRMQYIKGAGKDTGCPFCAAGAAPDNPDHLVIHRSPLSLVLLNKFPYNTGHSLVTPLRHVGELEELSPAELADLMETTRLLVAASRPVLKPQGFNIGLNLGQVAGAGLPGHLHLHVVPRWDGDHNFMQVTSETHVLPEMPPVTRRKLADAVGRILAEKRGLS